MNSPHSADSKNQTANRPTKHSATQGRHSAQANVSNSTADLPARSNTWPRLALGAMVFLAILGLVLGIYWSRQPETQDVHELIAQHINNSGGQPVPGTAFVATTIFVGDTLLRKPGGFLHNDRFPPGALMDNMPSWECGMVMALRDALQTLRNDFTRAQSQSREELKVKRADMQFAINPKSWMMPAAEDEYRKGLDALELYFDDLSDQTTNAAEGFYPRADNLAAYLGLVEKRLGNFGVRLSNSVADAGLAGITQDSESEPTIDGELDRGKLPDVDTVFYCARGYSWALLHFMRALEMDFAPVLESKHAEVNMQLIIRDLDGAVKRMRSPMVLNGHGYGLVANHSLVIASYISRVNAAIIDLKLLLLQG
ncbi:hypothetical protein Thiowin_02916 [Thiorhodovibrio winogradskyi]|uniref:DUF2333 family protein n=1 Tax=Thiorhodovibrio winogradskyi TaxID=77007 RepID=A0ABZ0SBH4_9GAMM|nr:DUF2333 family protein [Thiorhodovibrio winogradskyi]